MTDSKAPPSTVFKAFALAALAWAAAGILGCRVLGPGQRMPANLSWFFGFWALSLLNILALGNLMKDVLGYVADRARKAPENAVENSGIRVIRAFAWGTVKLICVGIFIVALLRGGDLSMVGKLLGAGTLAVVPLAGGLGVLRHA